MAGLLYLVDSNVFLRLVKRDEPEYPLVRGAVDALWDQGIELAYTLQNMTEFWNVSTRPRERNGFGLSVEKTHANAQEIERSFTFLADTAAVYREWRRIVVERAFPACRPTTRGWPQPCTRTALRTSSR